MPNAAIMKGKDTVSASLAECYAVLDGTRYNLMQAINLEATMEKGAQKLKEMLGCDKIVAFGDGVNDIPLFRAADESYAVENACTELKEIATAIIGSNEDDSVVKWLLKNAE